jgi:hypothetical protein
VIGESSSACSFLAYRTKIILPKNNRIERIVQALRNFPKIGFINKVPKGHNGITIISKKLWYNGKNMKGRG